MYDNSEIRGLRVLVHQPIHLNLNGKTAVVLNLSEEGIGIQALDALRLGDSFAITFPLLDLQNHHASAASLVQASGKVVWSDESGRAGLKFVELPEFDRFRLRRWLQQQQRLQERSN